MELPYLLATLAILLVAVTVLNVKRHGLEAGLLLTFFMILTAVVMGVLVAIFDYWAILVIALILLAVVVFLL